jgi:hypothetical protein
VLNNAWRVPLMLLGSGRGVDVDDVGAGVAGADDLCLHDVTATTEPVELLVPEDRPQARFPRVFPRCVVSIWDFGEAR